MTGKPNDGQQESIAFPASPPPPDPAYEAALARVLHERVRGREDVVAARWVPAAGEKAYFVKCRFSGSLERCPHEEERRKARPKEKAEEKKPGSLYSRPCGACETGREGGWVPYSYELLTHHVSGGRPECGCLGVYPLRPAGDKATVRFAVADLDGEGWHEEALCLALAWHHQGVHCLVERSQSGNGGHAWVFLSEDVDAELVRVAYRGVLKLAGIPLKKSATSTYDRIFPAQSQLTDEKPLGNLIAVPFAAFARLQGNSVFIDLNAGGVPFADQVAVLRDVALAARQDIERIAATVGVPEEKAALAPRRKRGAARASLGRARLSKKDRDQLAGAHVLAALWERPASEFQDRRSGKALALASGLLREGADTATVRRFLRAVPESKAAEREPEWTDALMNKAAEMVEREAACQRELAHRRLRRRR